MTFLTTRSVRAPLSGVASFPSSLEAPCPSFKNQITRHLFFSGPHTELRLAVGMSRGTWV